jgi:hypothetical protein
MQYAFLMLSCCRYRCRHHHLCCYFSSLLLLQVSPDSGLLQCSTVADVMDFTFAGSEVRHINLTKWQI